ncbi:MAG: serine/threonine-protein kinase, partial [Myxococcota bacterium]
SIDLPFEVASSSSTPFDMPERGPALLEINEPLRMIRVRELVVQICNALAYVHSRGLVHRDLKPSNILVDEDGDARLMDFGLCKALADLSDVTDSGQVVGTYRYMSPEQACGEPLDARSDLYSLGVVIYELLCGRPPFLAKNPLQLWEELLEREPPPLAHLNPGVDQRLAQVVHALLRKDPTSRLQTAEEVLEAVLE